MTEGTWPSVSRMIPPREPVTTPITLATSAGAPRSNAFTVPATVTQAGADVHGILYPEHGHVENQISHGAPADPGDDGKPHEPHHVHAFAGSHERPGHREQHGRKNVEDMDQPEEVRCFDHSAGHGIGPGSRDDCTRLE